ncbi:MAG: restriction endonuclease subunit S [Gammaproteobacteria bacterium]|nr:restriction endonuclease subunit S [Gammaproteobacteria bacterium]
MSETWSIPHSWGWARADDIAAVVGGGTPDTNRADYFGGKIAWLTPADLSGHTAKHIAKGARSLSEAGYAQSGAQLMPAGAVVFSSRAPIGYVAVAANPVSTNQGFKSFVPERGIYSDYLYYYLQRARPLVLKLASGTTFLEVSGKKIATLPVPVPPLAEQQRISEKLDELLSDLDAGVAALERVRAKLKHYRAAVLKAAVEGSLTAQWRHEHPATETADALLTRILAERRRRWEEAQLAKFEKAGKAPPKNWKAKYVEPISPDTADLPTLPEQWCWASLDQVCEIQGGLQKQPGRLPREHHFPYLRVANVHRGFVDLTELKRFELTEAERLRYRLETGDLLVVEGNGSKTEIGRCAIWKGEIEDCVHQNHIIRVRLINGIAPAFADQFLNSPTGQLAIQSIASSTSGLYTLSVAKIAKLPLAVSPRSEQAAIIESVEDQLSVIDHLERDLDARLKSAQSLRQSILRHAFTGQLVPQDLNDEPASELLKRIAAERAERARLLRASKQTKPKTRAPRAATKKK